MGVIITFALVTLLCIAGTLRSLKNKNFLATAMSAASVLVFGWFTVMTIIGVLGGHGIPAGH
ncbi:DUF2759 domain-containing protein [Bacillus sp. Marseille-P3661]|uniref:DUF2759 domain-containing protein n=1 Tax=Bacillus sp. Marseille-P3661 TaxID=1936234 RepID=UPI000C8476D9|nr:DUF2759 domain-containing protein [Bacillus sp. Marseille-P3661]